MGFSQGGAMSLFTGLQLEEEHQLAGLLCMSGYLPATSRVNIPPSFSNIPIMHCHGKDDPVVPYTAAEMTLQFIKSKGIKDYTLIPFTGGHTISVDVIENAKNFLTKILPHDRAFTVKPKNPREMGIKELLRCIKSSGLQKKAVGMSEKREYQDLLVQHYKEKYGDLFVDNNDD